MAARKYDVVVWGATGFTGKWVAKYLFENYPQSKLKWAIAARNADKLESVRGFLSDGLDDDAVTRAHAIDGIIADSDDEQSLLEMVGDTKVIISTVGPYAYYGSKLVKACAESGTHYVDLCGEVPWMREMIDAHHETAKKSGARIVNCCGFDSIPSDMGVYYTQMQAKQQLGGYLRNVRYSLTKAKGGISGGTIASMLNLIKQAVKDKRVRKLLLNPYSLNPDPTTTGVDKADQMGVRYSEELGKWTAPFVMAAVNTRVVRRSNALMNFRYSDDFSYSETMPTSAGVTGYMAAQAISAAIKSMALMGLTEAGRKTLGLVLPSQGKGPKVDPDNPGFYHIQFNGETANGESLTAQVIGDADPGYGSTSKMLSEAAVCLALDKLDVGGGFWTPSSAMGEALLMRLSRNAGLIFKVIL